jgi:8-oxo-dGTP pyrophosphatase MutT (NUDIX family)
MSNHVCKELVVPIMIDKVTIDTTFGRETRTNRRYHNTIVQDPKSVQYIQNQRRSDNYVRNASIKRCYDEHVTWPEHPLNVDGKMLGAIIIIESKDGKVLLVRNRKLWGLPKGARSYNDFITLKKETDARYRKDGHIMSHVEANFTDDDIESAVDNVCRETLEETGIEIAPTEVKPIYNYFQMNNRCAYDGFYYLYPKTSVEHNKDLQKNGTDHENDELLWVCLDDVSIWLRNHRSPNHSKVFNHITYGFLDDFMRNPSIRD